MQQWLEPCVAIAQEAGRAIMVVYARDFAVTSKADASPLTEADQAAHRLIAEGLRALTPGIPVLSEEETELPGRESWGQGRYWLVDPLDGTKEFIKKNGEFTVNIALIENGSPVLGVVHAPALGWTYKAACGHGAYKQTGAGACEAVRCATHRAGMPWRVVGSRSHGGDALAAWLAGLGDHALVSMGSSLKLCLVAEGAADIYPRLGPTSLWDTAAAQCVVEAAGGKVTTLSGTVLGYGNTAQLLNPYFIVTGISEMNWPQQFAGIAG
jgi:3'(2'), 5'-bisphosphate nucleotidase